MPSRRDILKAGLVVPIALAAPAILARPARAQAALRIQGFLAAASPTHRAFEAMAARLAERSGGALTIQTLPAGSVVGPAETIDAVGAGILDGHYSSSSFFAARNPAFIVYGDTGASYDDVATRDRWYSEGDGEALGRELYDGYDMHYVANVFWPSEHIPATKALNGVADLQNLKIRVPPGMISEIFGMAGAAVVNLPGGEVFNALQSGVIDATDWASPGQNEEVGLYRVAKFSVNAAHSMPATEIALSKRAWDGLSDEHRAMLEEEIRAMSAGLREQVSADDAAAIEKIRGEGVTIIEWPAEEVAKLRGLTSRKQDEIAGRDPLAAKIVASHRAFQEKVGI
ncbi:TRAP transporter substrate-binding protein DctP [Salinarimonas ramus]|uniref:Lactate-binding periplasmic protein n=1 Tax=Salinarimonas ramus TaxID=690164 RepID=A0A917Q3L3_9HYPH|nr:TRAP transporter substrate-binding protein DctP [Salinarimonas ramus]GGK20521.1 lactate-binding periplasmic protein [Salinarimonas ramus]